jgi:hypothetical protein
VARCAEGPFALCFEPKKSRVANAILPVLSLSVSSIPSSVRSSLCGNVPAGRVDQVEVACERGACAHDLPSGSYADPILYRRGIIKDYQLPAGRKKERLRLKSVESKERKVIRMCQRAATGRGRGQLPRRAPGICGVRGHACVQMMSYRGKGEREMRKEKRGKRDTAGSVVRSGELEKTRSKP